jgi:hypothetical protein
MANKNSPIGGRITGAIQSADFNTRISKYIIPAGDSQEYFLNDFVVTNETSEDGIPIVVKAADNQTLRGIITSFKAEREEDSTIYRAPNTRRIVYVCDDPSIEFEMQVSGTVASTDIGKNGDLLVSAGDPASGISGTQLDQTTLTTASKQIKILAIVDKPENGLGQYTKVRAIIYEHELTNASASGTVPHNDLLNLTYDTAGHGNGFTGFQRGTTRNTIDPTVNDDSTLGYVQGDFWVNTTSEKAFICVDNTATAAVWDQLEHSISDIWDRSGTTIQPSNAGDDLDMGTGNINATTANISGKLTVGGLLDPTALLLNPEAAAPATDNGTIYYNSGSNTFEFRENGIWHNLGETSIWQRTGTDISPVNAGDTVELDSTGGAQFGATGQNIVEFSTDGTLAGDSDTALPTEKAVKTYVDASTAAAAKQETLTISTPGQTAFTLSQTPSGADSFGLFLNGQLRYNPTDYTFTGTALTWNDPGGLTLKTTDQLLAWYDFQAAAGGSLAQDQIYYVGDAGNDSNSGRSVELPFLTVAAAVAAVLTQSPGINNSFEIKRIGAGDITESFTLPTYTTLNAPSARVNGTVTFSANSKLICDQVIVPDSSSGIVISTGVVANLKTNLIFGDTNNNIGINLSQGILYADVNQFSMIGSGGKAWDLTTGAVLHVTSERLRETVSSTKAGGSTVFKTIKDEGTNADTLIYNETGDIIADADGKNIILKDTSAGEIFTNVGAYPKWTNTPLLIARTSGVISNVTGDNTSYTILFDDEVADIGNHYNPATGIFTAPVTGFYMVLVSIGLGGLTASHDALTALINATGVARKIQYGNPATMRRNPGVNDDYAFGSGDIIKMTGGSTMVINVSVGTGTKVVDILTDSAFSVYLLGAA